MNVREMLDSLTGKALMTLMSVIGESGRQAVKNVCLDKAESEDLRNLLEAINIYERGLKEVRRNRRTK